VTPWELAGRSSREYVARGRLEIAEGRGNEKQHPTEGNGRLPGVAISRERWGMSILVRGEKAGADA